MSNIQNKIGVGIFKFQESIEKNKNKVDALKEIGQLSNSVEELLEKKLEMIIKLGIATHNKIRNGDLKDNDLNEICQYIVGFDYMIYENKKSIEEIRFQNEGITCECGNRLSENIKFCNQCGMKVEKLKNNINLIQCSNCEMNIDNTAKFCPCCGINLNSDNY